MISPTCKVLLKVSHKIYETQIVMFLYSVLVFIKQIKNVPICILLCIFLFHEDCNVLTTFPTTIATSSFTS